MHYYSFHVSDYIHDTAHLSIYEDVVFRRLLDLYYTSEKPIPNKTQEVSRRIRMNEHTQVVQAILEEFFDFDSERDCWFHKRCDKAIADYQAKAERNREVGKLGGRPKSNPNANPQQTQTVSRHNPNQEPITINHKPIKEKATGVACPDFVDAQVWTDFLSIRKAKKAPMTETALKGIEREAKKAGWSLEKVISECVTRGWQSFKADWVKEKLSVSEQRQKTMNELTRGMSTPKTPFWAKPDTLEADHVESKRLL